MVLLRFCKPILDKTNNLTDTFLFALDENGRFLQKVSKK